MASRDDGTAASRSTVALSLGALGVVFGDIGTSPLYALKACFDPEYGIAVTPANVSGLISLIVWSLVVIVAVKYVAFIMRADNHGEGGIFALLARILPTPGEARSTRSVNVLVALGLVGAALLYGDGVITPAISVLSAVEGVKVATAALARFVVPGSLLILVLLFAAQHFGTSRIGRVFGPLMLLWFGTLAVLGGLEVVRTPAIVGALSPLEGARFLRVHGTHALLVLGAVVLAVTGAEALYADMGHFGRRPIRLGWFFVVFPSLVLNYLGQGALLIRAPATVSNPFYLLAPSWLLLPLVVLSTLATIVASQALISGAFSLTQQAMQLGYVPRMRTRHTSADSEGQIYIPFVNTALMIGCLLLVLMFQTSEHLAAAYGIAVTGTMAVTSVLFFAVSRTRWGWSVGRAGALTALFLIVDLTFFGTNLLKVTQGGWVPLIIAAFVFVLMSTWRTGRTRLIALRRSQSVPFDQLFSFLDATHLTRVPGTAVFFTLHAEGTPGILMRQIQQVKALQDTVILVAVETTAAPDVLAADRVTVETRSHGIVHATAHVGFMEDPDMEQIMTAIQSRLGVPLDDRVYFTSRYHLTPTGTGGMAPWRKHLYSFMSRNAGSMADFLHIPPDRSVELGMTVAI